MFVLTQLHTFPQLLNSSPGKAIRACAPKVLSEPDLSWSGSGSGPGLVLVAAWLPRVTGGRSPVLPSHFWAASGLALIIFFIIMRKYAYRRRGYRGHKPSYTVNRKFCRNLTWNKLANDADIYTAAVQLVYNPSVESSNQLGTILTIKHLEVQLQDLPTYYGLNQDTNIVGHGSLAGGWICVYVPEGTLLNKPFPDYATERITIRSMNLISLCLDMVPGLKVGRSIRLTTFLR